MFTYVISTGDLSNDNIDSKETYIARCYSGAGTTYNQGRNNPYMCHVPNVGPIPPGTYSIGLPYDDDHLGPCVMHLEPYPETDTFNRSLFRMHGNNVANNASHGCIINGPSGRHVVASMVEKGDTRLFVKATPEG